MSENAPQSATAASSCQPLPNLVLLTAIYVFAGLLLTSLLHWVQLRQKRARLHPMLPPLLIVATLFNLVTYILTAAESWRGTQGAAALLLIFGFLASPVTVAAEQIQGKDFSDGAPNSLPKGLRRQSGWYKETLRGFLSVATGVMVLLAMRGGEHTILLLLVASAAAPLLIHIGYKGARKHLDRLPEAGHRQLAACPLSLCVFWTIDIGLKQVFYRKFRYRAQATGTGTAVVLTFLPGLVWDVFINDWPSCQFWWAFGGCLTANVATCALAIFFGRKEDAELENGGTGTENGGGHGSGAAGSGQGVAPMSRDSETATEKVGGHGSGSAAGLGRGLGRDSKKGLALGESLAAPGSGASRISQNQVSRFAVLTEVMDTVGKQVDDHLTGLQSTLHSKRLYNLPLLIYPYKSRLLNHFCNKAVTLNLQGYHSILGVYDIDKLVNDMYIAVRGTNLEVREHWRNEGKSALKALKTASQLVCGRKHQGSANSRLQDSRAALMDLMLIWSVHTCSGLSGNPLLPNAVFRKNVHDAFRGRISPQLQVSLGIYIDLLVAQGEEGEKTGLHFGRHRAVLLACLFMAVLNVLADHVVSDLRLGIDDCSQHIPDGLDVTALYLANGSLRALNDLVDKLLAGGVGSEELSG